MKEFMDALEKDHQTYSKNNPDFDEQFFVLGLCGEVGELANFVKKEWRDGSDHGESILLEAADIFVYLLMFCRKRGITFEELVATAKMKHQMFIDKMQRRD